MGSSRRAFNYKYIPQGIDLNFLKYSEKRSIDLVSKYNLKNKSIVGYAGSVAKSNPLDTLILAALKIVKKQPSIHFCILGDGHTKDDLVKLSKDSPNISFIDRVTKEHVLSFLNACDVLYDSVQKKELYNFGLSRNKSMDYMYSKKPMIISYSGYENITSKIHSGYISEAEDIDGLCNNLIKIY